MLREDAPPPYFSKHNHGIPNCFCGHYAPTTASIAISKCSNCSTAAALQHTTTFAACRFQLIAGAKLQIFVLRTGGWIGWPQGATKAGSYGNTKRNFCSGAYPKIMGGGVLGLKPPRNTPVAYQTTAPILSQTVADGLSPNLAGCTLHARGILRS